MCMRVCCLVPSIRNLSRMSSKIRIFGESRVGHPSKTNKDMDKGKYIFICIRRENWSLKKSENIEKSNHNVDIEIYWQACDSRVTPQNEQTNFCSSSSCPKRNDVCLNLAQMRLPPTKHINLFTTFIKSAKINSWAMFS